MNRKYTNRKQFFSSKHKIVKVTENLVFEQLFNSTN